MTSLLYASQFSETFTLEMLLIILVCGFILWLILRPLVIMSLTLASSSVCVNDIELADIITRELLVRYGVIQFASSYFR
jgi:hypothetical protein